MDVYPNLSCKKPATVQDQLDELDRRIETDMAARAVIEAKSLKPTAGPIPPHPELMPDCDMRPIQEAPPRPPPTNIVPSMSVLGLADDLRTKYNLETLQHCLQILLPSEPHSRGMCFQYVVDTIKIFAPNAPKSRSENKEISTKLGKVSD